MIDKIREVIQMQDSLVEFNEEHLEHCILPEHYDELAKDIVKLFSIPVVVKSFSAEQVVNELKDCETLDDAIMYFSEIK